MKPILREVRAHFTVQRCRYCGTRQDRVDGPCITPTLVSMFHLFPDGTGALQASNATAQELADAEDWDD